MLFALKLTAGGGAAYWLSGTIASVPSLNQVPIALVGSGLWGLFTAAPISLALGLTEGALMGASARVGRAEVAPPEDATRLVVVLTVYAGAHVFAIVWMVLRAWV